MNPKEYVLSKFDDAVVIEIDGMFYIDRNNDGQGYILSESTSPGHTWRKAMNGIQNQEKKSHKKEYSCPLCKRSDNMNRFENNNGLAFKCRYCDKFFRIY